MGGELEMWPQTAAERLTEAFYRWEIRGRGWQVWPYPVNLEPPFRPFLFHGFDRPPAIDDGRRPTFLSSVAEGVRGLLTRTTEEVSSRMPPLLPVEVEEPIPEAVDERVPLTELRLSLGPNLAAGRELTERLLQSLGACRFPVSFELIGLPADILIQFCCRITDLRPLQEQVQVHVPEATVEVRDRFLEDLWAYGQTYEHVVVDFGLSEEFMLPIRTFSHLEPDPLLALIGVLAGIREAELGLVQVLFREARHPWSESLLRAVTDGQGGSFFADAPQVLPLARKKVSRPLFAAVIRIAAQSLVGGRAWEIARALGGALGHFGEPGSNELIPLKNDDYPDEEHERDLVLRQTRRNGMLLNLEELVGLVHLPSPAVRSEKLKRETSRTKQAPRIAVGNRLVLGQNTHAGKTALVSLSPEHRLRHTYVIGASGTGKSTLLLNLIAQDIQNGEGIGVLDPHGDLIDAVLAHVPEERLADVVLLDPADANYPVGFNILSAHTDVEKTLLASDLVAVFRRLSTSWGDQMTSVLGNAILAFLESTRGGTLAELRRFLVEEDFRRAFLATVPDREVVYFWEREFPLLAGRPQAPLLTRLDTFLRPKLIRHMVAQKENRLDFKAIMNEGKIFLAKLAQGAIGEENAYLLGTLLVSKFHQLAIARQEQAAEGRRAFFLYIDEFHNFVTPSMASILSGARKYGLGLVLAHQELGQLASRGSEVASAVIANPYTRVCFRLGDQDARRLADGFSFFDAKDLQNLGIGEAICRIERAEYDFNLRTLPLPAVDAEAAGQRRITAIERSRKRYARRREELEAELAGQAKPAGPAPPTLVSRHELQPEEAVEPLPPDARQRPRERKSPSPVSVGPVLPGRGGAQHKYLQALIQHWGEEQGFRATIEKQILDGQGSVDVALERQDLAIACEISISSNAEQELGNIQKCLAAGFAKVLAVITDKKTLAKTEKLSSSTLKKEELGRVRFSAPDNLLAVLEELAGPEAVREETVKGYRVKVQYRSTSAGEESAKKQTIARTILEAMKRLKGKR